MIRVFKFGGSSFQSLEDYRGVAAFLAAELRDPADRLVVVTSAMAGLTERLRGLASGLSAAVSPEASDALLPLADTLGAAFLRIALEAQGVAATTLAGAQIGFRTDDNFGRARLVATDAAPLRQALERHRIVVVPGGQAIDARMRPTMLGKNSSDLTAVVLAGMLGLDSCEIFSDVHGVFSADPNLISDATLIEAVPYAATIDMSLSGAKVLHYGAVRAARDHGVRIVCRMNRGDFQRGSVVADGPAPRAVIVDHRAQILTFDGDDKRIEALALLRKADVPTIETAEDGELVVTCGFFDPIAFLSARGVAAGRKPGWLVSVFDGSGRVTRSKLGEDEALLFAKETHGRLYPELAATARAKPAASPAAAPAPVRAAAPTLAERIL